MTAVRMLLGASMNRRTISLTAMLTKINGTGVTNAQVSTTRRGNSADVLVA